MSPTVLAHAGHWLAQLVYLAPLAVIGVVLAREWLRARRRQGGDEGDGPSRP